MPHISRQFLKGDTEQKLVLALLDTLTKKGNTKQRAKVCRELFTGVERLMLAKRLAIICLLGEGASFEDISTKLKVSSSTVSRIWAQMQKGNFNETISAAKKNRANDVIASLLFSFLTLPRGKHEPRWKWLDELD